jgi:hypothetical protein
MMRVLILFLAMTWTVPFCRAEEPRTGEVEEKEPNDDPKAGDLIVVRPDCVLSGTCDREKDEEHFLLEAPEEMVCSIRCEVEGTLRASFGLGKVMSGTKQVQASKPFEYLFVRVPAGRHVVRIVTYRKESVGKRWKLEIRREKPGPDEDIEPNGRPDEALTLRLGAQRAGRCSKPISDSDFYRLSVPQRGIYRLRVDRCCEPGARGPVARFALSRKNERPRFVYECRDEHIAYVFYPVLEPGDWLLRVDVSLAEAGDRYVFDFQPFVPDVEDKLLAEARSAVTRGLTWLRTQTPEQAKREHYPAATEALVLATLAHGEENRQRREELVRDYVAWLGAAFRKDRKGTWKGAPVSAPSKSLYEVAIVVLGLAEAAEAGIEEAKPPCAAGVTYLLAAQQSPAKCKAWKGPMEKDHPAFGGWRYTAGADDGDLSVQGWCLVALLAADAAGIRVEGLRDAVTWGMGYARRCSREAGFTYQPRSGHPTNVRNGIGALLLTLWGEDEGSNRLLRTALEDLDLHLPAGTQVDTGEQYPLYHAYYGTRLNYLRGGYPWLAWRATMIRQLLRLQKEDGHWESARREFAGTNPRFCTALAVMILRVCLEDVPGYLRREVRGF